MKTLKKQKLLFCGKKAKDNVIPTEIKTPNGIIEICEPTTEMIKRLQTILPYGMMIEPCKEVKYGIVMQCDDKELNSLRLQPLEQNYEYAAQLFDIHHYLIMKSYCEYIKKGFLGAFLASPCITERKDGLWESVVALFIFPEKDETDPLPKKGGKRQNYLDDEFGKGAEKMFNNFLKTFGKEFNKLEVDKLFGKYISVAIRPRSYLGGLAMWFMVLDSHIICLRRNLREQEDSAWGFLASQGIKKVYYLPSHPMTISKSDLDYAKGLKKLVFQE